MFPSFLFVLSFKKLLAFITNSPIVSWLVFLVRRHLQKHNKLLMFKRTNPYVRINIMLNSQHNFVLYAFKNILEHAYLLCIMVKSLLSFACRIFDLSQMFTVHRTISTDKKYIKGILLPASHTQTPT